MLAVLVEDRYQKSVGPTEEAVEDKHDFLPNSVTADNGLFLLCLKIDLRKTASMETDRSNV